MTCPVALYPATTEAETVRFNLINPETNNRIRMKAVDAGTGEEVSRADLVKGFAIAKNEYVILDKEDFESVKLESTPSAEPESNVIDLMAALKRSLADAGKAPPTRAPAARKPANSNRRKPRARRTS